MSAAKALSMVKKKALPEAPRPPGADFPELGKMGLSKFRYYNSGYDSKAAQQIDEAIRLATTAQITSQGITFYTKREGKAKSPEAVFNTQNLTPGLKTKGFSANSARAVRNIVSEWAQCAQVERKGKMGAFGFWTFTLPADQGYQAETTDEGLKWQCTKRGCSDTELKRNVLNTLLQYITRRGGLYVWRAETQANGNIHFHLVTDIFLPIAEMGHKWAYWLSLHTGLVDEYLNNNPDLAEWSNGVDVEFLRNADAAGGYVAKYFSKDDPEQQRRPIEGKQWGCSAQLRLLKPPAFHRNADPENFAKAADLAKLLAGQGWHTVKGDYFGFVAMSPFTLKHYFPDLASSLAAYRGQMFAAVKAEKVDFWALYQLRQSADPALKALKVPWDGAKKVNFTEFAHFHNIKSLAGLKLPFKIKPDEIQRTLSESKPNTAANCPANKSQSRFRGMVSTSGNTKPQRALAGTQTRINL